jgi:hypothetical protein
MKKHAARGKGKGGETMRNEGKGREGKRRRNEIKRDKTKRFCLREKDDQERVVRVCFGLQNKSIRFCDQF